MKECADRRTGEDRNQMGFYGDDQTQDRDVKQVLRHTRTGEDDCNRKLCFSMSFLILTNY